MANRFELQRLLQHDDESLLNELRRVAAIRDGPITTPFFEKHGKVSTSLLKRRFGGWQAALERAGLGDRYSGKTVSPKMRTQSSKQLSNEELISEIQRVAKELESSVITQLQFNENSKVSTRIIINRFGSFKTALEKAGLQLSRLGRRYTDEEYFENLLAVWTHQGRQPYLREMNEPPSKITARGYESKWGNWSKALLAFIDKANADVEKQPSDTPSTATQVPEARPRREAAPGLQRKIPLGIRYEVLRRDRFQCVLCGASPAKSPCCELHVDHVVAYSRGGQTVLANLRTLCSQCNVGKGAKPEVPPGSQEE